MGGVEGARWQSDGQLHLTLAFFGTVDRHQAEALHAGLEAVRARAFALRLGPPGAFETARGGRVSALWRGVMPHDAVGALAAAVRQAARLAGVVPDARRFVPHVTVARFAARGGDPAAIRPWVERHQPPAPDWEVTGFHLVESRMGREGAHYESHAYYQFIDIPERGAV